MGVHHRLWPFTKYNSSQYTRVGLARGIGRHRMPQLCLLAEACQCTLEAGSVFVSANKSRHRRHCAPRRPWADTRSQRCLARSDPGSHSICCWNSRAGQRSPRDRLPRLARRQRDRPGCTRCSMAGSDSPPLRIGSQTNQLNCSDHGPARSRRRGTPRGEEGYGVFYILTSRYFER